MSDPGKRNDEWPNDLIGTFLNAKEQVTKNLFFKLRAHQYQDVLEEHGRHHAHCAARVPVVRNGR